MCPEGTSSSLGSLWGEVGDSMVVSLEILFWFGMSGRPMYFTWVSNLLFVQQKNILFYALNGVGYPWVKRVAKNKTFYM